MCVVYVSRFVLKLLGSFQMNSSRATNKDTPKNTCVFEEFEFLLSKFRLFFLFLFLSSFVSSHEC